MKRTQIIIILMALVLGMSSCKKDEDRVVFDPAKVVAPQLNSELDGTQIEITTDNIDSAGLVLNWTASDYGFNAAITYTVQMDLQENNFTNAFALGTTSGETSLNVSYNDLNNFLLLMENDPESPVALDVEFRVLSLISDAVDTIYSNTIKMNIKPVYIPIVYPQLYVPGAYQGWNPATADSIGSLNSDGKFEGYIYMAEASEFKFTSARDWDHTNYGDAGEPGKLTTENGLSNNLSVPEGGFYKFNVNTNELTWSYLKTTWGLIGDATAGGWDTDTPMEYDEETQLWSVTADLSVGDIKFRANGGWELNYGSDDQNGRLQQGGGNIHVDEAGNYTVILDLSTTVYKYRLEKND